MASTGGVLHKVLNKVLCWYLYHFTGTGFGSGIVKSRTYYSPTDESNNKLFINK